jgi:S-adenosylmethionine hydrolase
MRTLKPASPLIASFTDFGPTGPYQGQMAAVLAALAPQIPHITLMSDAPMFDAQAAGILLARLCADLPANSLVLAVVDPGVGGSRRPLMIRTECNLFVGPDNGLFVPVLGHSDACDIETIQWRPERLSESFHGRDLFAPVAARLATGHEVAGSLLEPQALVGFASSPGEPRIIYIDHYGNAMTSIDANHAKDAEIIRINGLALRYARTFAEVPAGQGFWYRNSLGLLELAVNRGNAAKRFDLELGMPVEI